MLADLRGKALFCSAHTQVLRVCLGMKWSLRWLLVDPMAARMVTVSVAKVIGLDVFG